MRKTTRRPKDLSRGRQMRQAERQNAQQAALLEQNTALLEGLERAANQLQEEVLTLRLARVQEEQKKMLESLRQMRTLLGAIYQQRTDDQQTEAYLRNIQGAAAELTQQYEEAAQQQGPKDLMELYDFLDARMQTLSRMEGERAKQHQTEKKNLARYLRKVQQLLAGYGIARLHSEPGTKFDSRLHQCSQVDFDPDHAVVADSRHDGFCQGDRVLQKEIVDVREEL